MLPQTFFRFNREIHFIAGVRDFVVMKEVDGVCGLQSSGELDGAFLEVEVGYVTEILENLENLILRHLLRKWRENQTCWPSSSLSPIIDLIRRNLTLSIFTRKTL